MVVAENPGVIWNDPPQAHIEILTMVTVRLNFQCGENVGGSPLELSVMHLERAAFCDLPKSGNIKRGIFSSWVFQPKTKPTRNLSQAAFAPKALSRSGSSVRKSKRNKLPKLLEFSTNGKCFYPTMACQRAVIAQLSTLWFASYLVVKHPPRTRKVQIYFSTFG